MAFQAYLLEGVTRWNAERAAAAVDDTNPTQLYSFDVSLKHQLNSLSRCVLQNELLPNFTLPGAYTGERIGVDYLHAQTGEAPISDLEAEIDRAFEDFETEATETHDPPAFEDITLALPDEMADDDISWEVGIYSCSA